MEFALNARRGYFQGAFRGIRRWQDLRLAGSNRFDRQRLDDQERQLYLHFRLPQAAGNVTIGAAEVKVDGSSYRTRPLPIEIVNEGEGPRAQQQQGGSNRADDTQADAQSRIGKDDILLRAVVSRTSVYTRTNRFT